MINLDAAESFESLLADYETKHSLYIVFAKWLCESKITYVEFQKLAKWTNSYYYVFPKERDMIPELSDFLYSRNRYNLFNLALLVSHLQANLTQEMQHILLGRLRDDLKPDYPVEKSPENCGTLTPTPPDQ